MEEFSYNPSAMKRGPVLSSNAKIIKEFKLDMEVLSWIREESDKRGIERELVVNEILKDVMSASSHKKAVENLVENPKGATK